MTQYTPIPWEAYLRETVGNKDSGILERWSIGRAEPMDTKDPGAGTILTDNICDVRDWSNTIAKANAEYIVKACNNYPAMLKALREISHAAPTGSRGRWRQAVLDIRSKARAVLDTIEGQER